MAFFCIEAFLLIPLQFWKKDPRNHPTEKWDSSNPRPKTQILKKPKLIYNMHDNETRKKDQKNKTNSDKRIRKTIAPLLNGNEVRVKKALKSENFSKINTCKIISRQKFDSFFHFCSSGEVITEKKNWKRNKY